MLQTPVPALGTARYRYKLNGADAPITEHHSSVNVETGRRVTGRRTAPRGIVLEVSAEFDRHGLMRASMILESDGQPTVRARYSALEDRLSVSRSIDGEPAGEWEQSRSGGFITSPLLRVFQGPSVASCLDHDGTIPVVVPDLRDPADLDAVFVPLWHERRSTELGRDVVLVGDDTLMARRCNYTGGGYDDTAEFWITDDNRLARYRFRQDGDHLWQVRLVPIPESGDGNEDEENDKDKDTDD